MYIPKDAVAPKQAHMLCKNGVSRDNFVGEIYVVEHGRDVQRRVSLCC